MGQSPREATGDGHDDDREPSIQSTEAGATEGTSTDQLTTPMVGWDGANLWKERGSWSGTMRPNSRWGLGVPPAGWAGASHPAEPEGYTGWLTPPHIPMDSFDSNATMIEVECNCHYDHHRGISCTVRRQVSLG